MTTTKTSKLRAASLNTSFNKTNDLKAGLPASRLTTYALTKKPAKPSIIRSKFPSQQHTLALKAVTPEKSSQSKLRPNLTRAARIRRLVRQYLKDREMIRELRRHPRSLFKKSINLLKKLNPASTVFVLAVENTKTQMRDLLLKDAKRLVTPATMLNNKFRKNFFNSYRRFKLRLGQFRHKCARLKRRQRYRRRPIVRQLVRALPLAYERKVLNAKPLIIAPTFSRYSLNHRFFSSVTHNNTRNQQYSKANMQKNRTPFNQVSAGRPLLRNKVIKSSKLRILMSKQPHKRLTRKQRERKRRAELILVRARQLKGQGLSVRGTRNQLKASKKVALNARSSKGVIFHLAKKIYKKGLKR